MKRYGRSMLSEDQVKWIVNAKLEGKLTGKLQACKAYQPEGYSSFTANTKVQGLFMFRKRLEGINSLCLSKLNMKSLSFTKCTEPMRAISAKFSERKDTALTTTGSTKYSKRLVLQ